MRVWCAILFVVLVAPPASAQVHSVELFGPRPFGFLIGDLVRHDIEIKAEPGFEIADASLPKPGPLTYWLDLRTVELEALGVAGGVQRFVLRLDYQTFYAPLQPQALEIPSFTVMLLKGEERASAVVPAWTFLMSPLREIMPGKVEGGVYLRPDLRPQPIDLSTLQWWAGGSAAANVVFFLLLARHRAWWPFQGRSRRPFAQAVRAARRGLEAGEDAAAYCTALLAFHRAFDATAGRRLMADDLPDFLTSSPAFQSDEPDLRRFFLASRRAFFGSDVAGAMALLPPGALLELGRRLTVAERAKA